MDNGFKYEEQAPVCTEDGFTSVRSFCAVLSSVIFCRWVGEPARDSCSFCE